jgi:thioesterase domain-containing protein
MPPIVILSGAGGGTLDPTIFREGIGEVTPIKTLSYPGWRRYIENGFSAEVLIGDLVARIATWVPRGPICIVGNSIGGHFGYAAALRLEAAGREIAGFCAIDSFMVSSAAPSAGWKGRALARGSELLRKRRIGEFSGFLHSRFWRALFRLSGSRLPSLLRAAPSGWLPWVLRFDSTLENELSMRLLLRETAPWIASLDRQPIALKGPAVLLRTKLTASDDAAWRRRCPGINVIEVPGDHQTLFEPENIGSLSQSFIAATLNWRRGAKETHLA